MGIVENPCCSKVMVFLIHTYCGFLMDSSVTECTGAVNATQSVFNNLLWVIAFTNDIFVSVMASNTVNGL